MSRVGTVLVAAAFAALIMVPGILWLTGWRSDEIENRALAEPPRITTPSALVDEETYAQATEYLVDHLPLRQEMVSGYGRVNMEAFDESPNPDVLLGDDDWLFLRETLTNVCEPPVEPWEMATRMTRLTGIIAGSGREVVLTIAPDKNAVYGDMLGDTEADAAACAADNREELIELLEVVRPPGYLDAYGFMRDLRETWDDDVYYTHDTHWTTRATAELVGEIIDGFDDGLWDPEAITTREEGHTGDLTRMIGMPTDLETQRTFVDRPGVVTPGLEGDDRMRPPGDGSIVPEGPDDLDVLPGRTLIIFDSFFDNAIGMISPYTEETTFVRWGEFDAGRFAELVAEHDRIIIEAAERDSHRKYGVEMGSEDYADALIETLGG